jgi:hypothetical protein
MVGLCSWADLRAALIILMMGLDGPLIKWTWYIDR